MADLTQAPESAGDAIAFLGEWLADDVQTPTREEIKLARAVALALAEIRRLTTEPTPITTANQIRALPVGTVLFDSPSSPDRIRASWQVLEDVDGDRYVVGGNQEALWLPNKEDVRLLQDLAIWPLHVLYTPGGDRA